MNLVKENFINRIGEHHIQHQWYGMPYIYVMRHSKCTDYYLDNFQWHLWKALKTFYEKGSFSRYCILMIDEMYLQKSAHQSGDYVEVDKGGNLYKKIIAFMAVGLKQSIPFVVQAIQEVKFNGPWLAEKISDNIDKLIEIRLCVQGIVTDNHSANIKAFSALIKIFNSESNKRCLPSSKNPQRRIPNGI